MFTIVITVQSTDASPDSYRQIHDKLPFIIDRATKTAAYAAFAAVNPKLQNKKAALLQRLFSSL